MSTASASSGAVLTVGTGQQFATTAAAVAAARDGDTIDVSAGTYTNDFVTIGKSLTLQAVGGRVEMVATRSPPNGKAILTEGGAGKSVVINGFDFSGAQVADNNGAGIRYEGGSLTLSNDGFYNNQDGLLGAADPNGTITIDHSQFSHNGAGDGRSHNIYIGDVRQATIQNSLFTDAVVGHEIKSRAETTIITNNRIEDGATGTASYEIDLPNAGNATITGNVIEKGPHSQNGVMISYGEEGSLHAGQSLLLSGNTLLADKSGAHGIRNATGTAASITSNQTYGFSSGQLNVGPASVSGTVALSREPGLDTSAPWATGPSSSAPASVSAQSITPLSTKDQASVAAAPQDDTLVLNLSEDAWRGDARFIVAVDGKAIGGAASVSALHSQGQSEAFIFTGQFGSGPHDVAVSFLNDAWGGSTSTDRNLYVNSVAFDGNTVSGTSAALYTTSTHHFAVGPVGSVTDTGSSYGTGVTTLPHS